MDTGKESDKKKMRETENRHERKKIKHLKIFLRNEIRY